MNVYLKFNVIKEKCMPKTNFEKGLFIVLAIVGVVSTLYLNGVIA